MSSFYRLFCSTDGKFQYKYLGCYRDKRSPRALPLHYFNARKYANWFKKDDYNFKMVIDMCATHARNKNDLRIFGVQNYGECWGGNASSRYNRYRKSEDCISFPGVPGVGKDWASAVYELVCKRFTFYLTETSTLEINC